MNLDDENVAFFQGVMGFLHILSPLNLIEGQTRYRYLWYYSFEGVENLFITLIPVLMMKNFLFPNKLWLLIYVVVSFSLGILCMILYYLFLHPNGTKCTQSEVRQQTLGQSSFKLIQESSDFRQKTFESLKISILLRRTWINQRSAKTCLKANCNKSAYKINSPCVLNIYCLSASSKYIFIISSD